MSMPNHQLVSHLLESIVLEELEGLLLGDHEALEDLLLLGHLAEDGLQVLKVCLRHAAADQVTPDNSRPSA